MAEDERRKPSYTRVKSKIWVQSAPVINLDQCSSSAMIVDNEMNIDDVNVDDESESTSSDNDCDSD